ncbi:MAG: TonB-dependent receptor [Planctomycetota bacterium]|nr:TonB-dependent receptor [Planctomycetota bacterium]
MSWHFKKNLLCVLAIHLVVIAGLNAESVAQDWIRATPTRLQIDEDSQLAPLERFGTIEPPAEFAPQPPAPSSSLFLRLSDIAAPNATEIIVAEQAPQIETLMLTQNARQATSSSRVRRSQVAMQPNIRGLQQQSIFAQYQGAQFVPVRYDLDSILTSIDPGIIENLVIIPGPYGVKYGPGLAFIDLVAAPLPRSDVFEWDARTSLLYRSNGGQFYGRETVTGSGADYGTRVSYGQKTGSDYLSGDSTQIPASYNVLDVNVAVNFDLTPESTIQFEYLLQNMSDTEFAGLAFDALLRQTDAFFLRYEHHDDASETKWLAEAWYNRTFFEGDNLNASKQSFYQPNPVFVPIDSFVGVTDADVTSSGFRVAPSIGNTESGQLTAGVDFHFTAGELNEFDDFDDIGIFDSFPIPRAQTADVGLFTELFVPVLADSSLKFGGRLDWVRTEQAAVYSSFDPTGVEHIFDFGDDFAADDQLYHAFVTADHPLSDTLLLKAGFGHGQRPPNLTERFALDPFLTLVQNATSAVIGDETLKPERASQFDLALHGTFDAFRFQLNGYWSHIDEHITLAPATGIPPDPDLRLLDFVNNDSVLAGAEASGEIDLSDSWMAFGRMSYVDGRNLDRHEPLASIYPLQSRLGLLWYDPVDNRYGVEFAAMVVDNQNRVATSLLEATTPGFAKFDLRGYYQATDAIHVTIGFENIGNRNYLEHLSVHNPQVLEPGFSFYMATQIDL